MNKFRLICLSLFLFQASFVLSQNLVSGVVKDAFDQSLPGASILEKGTLNGVITDVEGKFTISVAPDAILRVSYVGYETTEVSVAGKINLEIVLQSQELEEVVVVGSRAAPRSATDTPLPVDILSSKDLVSTGQPTFDKALQYRVPSFNTVQTPVNDATSLLDPYEIRNMGPSRTLILINGKRKNLSALLYTQVSPGRGETGADISAIPTDAIKRVEVLRDGASAQYGSDAIAGVMNIILKDDVDYGVGILRSGLAIGGPNGADGLMLGLSVNSGNSFAKGKGFVNYTADFSRVGLANRPGTVSIEGESADFGPSNPGPGASPALQQAYQVELARFNAITEDFLRRRPDAGNINGSPETMAAKFLVNAGVDIHENMNIYANAAYVYKKVNSFANYRTPYWRRITQFPYLSRPGFFRAPNTIDNYDGYVPTFDGDLSDYNATLGFKAKRNGWIYDLSFTVGGNTQLYTVRNSHNRSQFRRSPFFVDTNGNGQFDVDETFSLGASVYRENSPTSFSPGGSRFSHIVGNIDISKALSERVSIGFGSEFRSEDYEIIAGGEASYDGLGADSFAGNTPENSGRFNRYNLGAYFDVVWDIIPSLLVGGTARVENYSDFGVAFVWRVNSRYKLWQDRITLRASYSTGFRAPTLHQIYTQKAQYGFVPGQGVQREGFVNNVSPQAKALGVPRLTPERSSNITVGVGAKPIKNLSITVDYYNISVADRIVLGNEIKPTKSDGTGNTELDRTLRENQIGQVSFFVNALDTRTSGLDVVVGYKNLKAGRGFFDFTLSGNYTLENRREGSVKNPKIIADANQSVLKARQEAIMFTSRPVTKWILGISYDIGKFGFALNNTLFGKTMFKQDGLDVANLRTEFDTKVVTDLSVTYSPIEKITIAFNANNIFNILPTWKVVAENAAGQAIIDDKTITATGLTNLQNQINLITFNGRYSQMTYNGFHFSQLGALLNLSFSYKFL